MTKFISLLASSVFTILGSILAGAAIVKGEEGLGAVAIAILALLFKLEAELPEFKDAIRQRRQ
ncbi:MULTISPECIES: hypothetical protein [Achromobacter]